MQFNQGTYIVSTISNNLPSSSFFAMPRGKPLGSISKYAWSMQLKLKAKNGPHSNFFYINVCEYIYDRTSDEKSDRESL